jgi:hypothetical protein
MSGAANFGCSRLSGGSAGPAEGFWRGDQAGRDRVVLDVTLNASGLFTVSDKVIVTFVLPEMVAGTAENLIGLVSCEAFERAEPLSRDDMRCDQQVNVVRHDNEGVEIVAAKAAFSCLDGFDYAFCDFRDFQVERAGLGFVQDSVHCYEGFSSGQGVGWKFPIRRETAPEAESNKEGLAYHVPVRQASCVVLHQLCSASTIEKFSGDLALRRLKAGCSQDWLPHYA